MTLSFEGIAGEDRILPPAEVHIYFGRLVIVSHFAKTTNRLAFHRHLENSPAAGESAPPPSPR